MLRDMDEILKTASRKIVDDCDFMTAFEQEIDEMRANEAPPVMTAFKESSPVRPPCWRPSRCHP
jgi:hypothetical protein